MPGATARCSLSLRAHTRSGGKAIVAALLLCGGASAAAPCRPGCLSAACRTAIIHTEGVPLPLRLLDGFTIHVPGDADQLVQLENLRSTHPRPVATGALVAPGEGAVGSCGDGGGVCLLQRWFLS
jgi:hypothetical protein